MATTLYFRDSTPSTHLGTNNTKLDGNASAWYTRGMSTARGAGVTAYTTNTVAGTTNGVEVVNTSPVEWITDPVDADVTISGTITANIWASESGMNANVAINVIIDIIRATDNSIVNIVKSTRVTEVALTTRAVNNFTTGMTSGGYTGQTLNKGDRLRIRIFGDDAGTMGTGFTFSVGFNGGTAAADGDSYVTFNETFSFLTTAPSGTTLYLTNSQSGLEYGTTVPALISDFTGSNENPLSEGGNWAQLDSNGTPLQRSTNGVAGTGGDSYSYWTLSNFGPDLEAYVSLLDAGTTGIVVRIQGEGGASTFDGYGVFVVAGAALHIFKLTDASPTSLASFTVGLGNSDKIGIRIVGSTIQAWYQKSTSSTWNLGVSLVDTTYSAAGKIGLLVNGISRMLDDFYAATNSDYFTSNAPNLISNFTGSNENPLSEGGNWANLNSSGNPLQRVSNAVQASTSPSASYWKPGNFGPDLEAYFTITSAGTLGISARITGEGGAATWDGYRVLVTTGGGGVSGIESITNATSTTLISGTPAVWAVGDKLGIRIEDSTIQLWRLASGGSVWNILLSAVDTTYADEGKIAVYVSSGAADDFYAATNSNLFTQQAWTSRGTGVVSYVSDTVAGWTPSLFTSEWFTRKLNAFTLTGLARGNIRALESNALANASMRVEIARVDSNGANPTVWSSWLISPATNDFNGELGTSERAETVELSGDDLSISDGQRLRIRLYLDDIAGAAMADTYTATTYYNGTSGGASGDTYITLAQTISEYIINDMPSYTVGTMIGY